MFKKPLTILFGLVFLLVACGPAATPDTMMEETPTHDTMMETSPTPDDMMGDMATQAPASDDMMNDSAMGDSTMSSPAWFDNSFTDASTGMTYSINDFKGKVVLVETLAMWCPTCLAQQKQVLALHGMLGTRDDFVSIGLDIDPNENLADLKVYVASNGFDWYYAVTAPGVAREIGQLYGDQFLNPPSTPMLIVDRHGEAHPLPFGLKSADDLLKALTPYLDAGM